jgi:signal transduction histidine kinase
MTFLSQFDFWIVLIALVGNISLGLFTLYKNFKSATNRIFFLFTISLALYNLFNYLSLYQQSDIGTLFWIKAVISIAIIINILFFLLIIVFPQTKVRLHPLIWAGSILYSLGLFVLSFTNFIFVGVVPSTNQPIVGVGMPFFILDNIIFLGGGFVVLFHKLRKSSGLAKTQLKLLLLGTIFMFALIILTNVFFVIILRNTSFVGLLPVYTSVFVGFVTYAIVRHRFLDIRFIVARSVTYSFLLIILALFYTSDVFLISRYFFSQQISMPEAFAYSLIGLFVALTFQPLKKLLEQATEEVFFKTNYTSHDLLSKLTKIMASTLRLDDLLKNTLHELITTLHVSRGAFVIFNEREKDGIYPIVSEGFESTPIYDIQMLRTFSDQRRIFIFEEEEESKFKQYMRDVNLTIVLPLFEDDHVLGVMLIGEKKSGDIYSQQDIGVLEIFGPEVSVAIQNAKSYEEIARFNFTLKEEVDRATKDLQEANARLKVLDKLKDEFVSLAAHELRTPMTAIKSYLSLALTEQAKNLNDDLKLYIHRSYISAERLIKLVNNMLNVSRIESGRVGIEVERVEMLSLCQEVLDEVKPRADELGVQVLLDRTTVPSPVMADADKIKEVLINLIGNSLKFTPSGGSVTLSFANKEDMVEIRVKDTGVGIEPGDLFKLFHKFGVLPGSYTKVQSDMGTGLGLYISKSIVEMNEGKMWAESEGKGHGATFIFTLPVFSEERLEKFQEKHRNEGKEGIGLEHTQL